MVLNSIFFLTVHLIVSKVNFVKILFHTVLTTYNHKYFFEFSDIMSTVVGFTLFELFYFIICITVLYTKKVSSKNFRNTFFSFIVFTRNFHHNNKQIIDLVVSRSF